MTYQPKFQPCPYRDSIMRCFHKKSGCHKCPYKKCEKCEIYVDWYNSSPDRRKMILTPINTPKRLSYKRSKQ